MAKEQPGATILPEAESTTTRVLVGSDVPRFPTFSGDTANASDGSTSKDAVGK